MIDKEKIDFSNPEVSIAWSSLCTAIIVNGMRENDRRFFEKKRHEKYLFAIRDDVRPMIESTINRWMNDGMQPDWSNDGKNCKIIERNTY